MYVLVGGTKIGFPDTMLRNIIKLFRLASSVSVNIRIEIIINHNAYTYENGGKTN